MNIKVKKKWMYLIPFQLIVIHTVFHRSGFEC